MAASRNSRTALRLALMATAVVSMAACSSRPKPSFPSTPAAGSTAPASPNTRGQAPPPVSGGALGALPGSQQDFVVNVGDRVYFDFDQYDIRGDATPLLDAQGAWLRRYPAVSLRIEGNADELGTREYNLALGARRANAVRDYLAGRGVTGDRISTVSFGKEQPIDTGVSDEAHARNRNARTAIVGGAR